MISKILLIGSSIFMIASCSDPAQTSIEPMPTLTPIPETQIISPTPTPPESQEGLIAFAGDNEQTTSIGLMTSDGQDIRYVTDDAGNELLPKWSPDGQYLAYLSDRQIPLDEYDQQFYDLWLLSVSNEKPARLTNEGQVDKYLTTFAWSPDSDKIVYIAWPTGVKVIDLTDLSDETLGIHFSPPFAWSVKDELAIADHSFLHTAIISLAILASDFAPVLPPEESYFVAGGHYPLNTAHSMAWSPDGEQLAIGSSFALRGPSDLRIVSIVEDEVVTQASLAEKFGNRDSWFPTFPPPTEITDVAWSPDGTMIAFRFSNRNDIIKEPEDDNIEQIYITNNELTELLSVTPENIRCNYPQWSPDSTRLVFACQGEGEENSDVWLVYKDGSDLRQLTNTPTYEGQPMWQPEP